MIQTVIFTNEKVTQKLHSFRKIKIYSFSNPNAVALLQLLCAKGTHILQTKSKLAEDSVQELINLIMNYRDPNLNSGDDSDADEEKDDEQYDGMSSFGFLMQEAEKKKF